MSDKPSLLSLPVEIRLQIYSCLDHDDYPIEYPLSEPYGSQASYLLTCRQLRYEMQHDFFSNNVFAIRYDSDMRMGSTKHPLFKAIHTMAGKFGRIDDLQLPMFHVQRTGRLFDTTLEADGHQESTDLRAFDRFSALSDDLKMIENLQFHMIHKRSHTISLSTHYDMLLEYVINCKEQLNVVLEALVVLKTMKGPLGLKKLTVVDNVPYKRHGRCATGRLRLMGNLKAMFLDAYWPLLTQAAATLGISIENVKVEFYTFPETDDPIKAFGLPARLNKGLLQLP